MATIWTDISKAYATSWSGEQKPVSTTSVLTTEYGGGEPIGLLLALTHTSFLGTTSVVTSKWSSVISNTTSWSDIPKAQ